VIRVLVAALVTSATVAAAQAQLPDPEPKIAAAASKMGRKAAPHEVTFANGVRSTMDLPFWAPVGYRPLTLDVYLPPASVPRPKAGFPLVVQIHGGGWMIGDKRISGPFVDWPSVLASLAATGYVVAAVDYRLSSEAQFPVQAQDVKAAIRWLRLNASKYGIDRTRVVTWGESAGAHLAALAAVSCGADLLEPKEPTNIFNLVSDVTTKNASDCVQGGIAWFGVFDMTTIQAQAREVRALSRDERDAPEWRLLGCFATQCRPAQLAAASPITYVDRRDPPMLLIVGDADKTVPMEQTLQMAERLDSAGVKNQVLVLPGVTHEFLGKTPEATRQANLKALAATFQFIDDIIGTTSRAADKVPATSTDNSEPDKTGRTRNAAAN
jgi:acetyl esterase/lipase